MTDQGRPLSRRERREAEARAAAPDQPTTPIPRANAATFTNPDGTPLTRKQRRAIEREDVPLETWTLEEQMVATGQLPTMTPDLLAAQEMVERRRAEERAESEAVASAEPDTMVDRARSMFTPEPVAEPEPAVEPEDAAAEVAEPSQETADDAMVEQVEAVESVEVSPQSVDDAVVEPVEPSPETVDDAVVEAEVEAEVEAAAVEAPVDAPVADESPAVEIWEQPTQVMSAEEISAAAPDEQATPAETPEPSSEPEPEAAADEPAPAEPVDEPVPAADGIPEQYRHLFPPGSLQARRLEERLARGETITPPSGTPAPAEPQGEDPAEEIRRLTAAAMAGITRAQQVRLPESAATPAAQPEAAPEALPEAESAPAPAPETVPAPQVDAQPEPAGFAPVLPPVDAPEPTQPEAPYAPPSPASSLPSADSALPQRGEVPVSEQPTQALPPVEQPVAPAPQPQAPAAAAPLRMAPAVAPAVLRPAGMPASGDVPAAAAAAPSVWENHPLAVAQPREVADYAPSQDIPIPDFTKIMHGYASTSSSAGVAPVGRVGDEPIGTDIPALTGGIEVPRRAVPEEQEEHGHGWGWQHLAVIAAAAFLLGVLVWNLAWNA